MGFPTLSPQTTRIITLALRVLTAVILFVSFIILVVNNQPYRTYKLETKVLRFYDKIGYRYAAAGILLGIAYSIYQTVCAVVRMKKENEGNIIFDFYAEKVISNLLVSAAAAGFVTTGEILNQVVLYGSGTDRLLGYERFVSLSNSSSGLVLLGCIFSTMLSVLSSYALARNDD